MPKATTYLQAAADPCFFFDFDSPKVTPTTLITSTINIENSGNTIGGGGYGGRGSYTVQSGKGAVQRPGGGGGGGMGLHQAYDATTVVDPPHLFNNYDWNKLNASSGRSAGGASDESAGTEAGVGGQSGTYGGHAVSFSSNPSANGTAGDIDDVGAGGIYGNHSNFVTTPSTTAQTAATGAYGGWGGSVVYIKSNVDTTEAYTGLSFNLINKSTGFCFAGSGGGGGGADIIGSGGSGGGWYGAFDGDGYISNTGAGKEGLRGMIFFINTSNVAISKTYSNKNSAFGFKGRDAP